MNSNKQRYKGIFNWHGQLITLWVHAHNEKGAKGIFIKQLSDKLNRPQWGVRKYFTGAKDNFKIKLIIWMLKRFFANRLLANLD